MGGMAGDVSGAGLVIGALEKFWPIELLYCFLPELYA